MMFKVVTILLALITTTLVAGSKHDDLLAAGYEYVPNVGYYYFGTQKNWLSAQQDCLSNGARLVVINSEEEREVLASFLNNHTTPNIPYVYAGFTNLYESRFVTTEGIPLDRVGFAEWEGGTPSGDTSVCGVLNTTTALLSDFSCWDYTKPYVCEHELWSDYTLVEGIGYYKMHTVGKPWADAYEICENEGGHLLVIDSQAEADAVMEIYNEHPDLPNATEPSFAYIGFRAVMSDLNADPNQGIYLTIFGTSVSKLGYVKWHGIEPQPHALYFCGALTRDSGGYYMKMCSQELAFFCEKELEEFSKT